MHKPLPFLLIAVLLRLCYAQDAPSNVTLQFMEDTREGFLQHAVLNFSWTPPTDVDGYELTVEHVPPNNPNSNRHSCSLTQDTVNISLPADSSNFILMSENGSFDSLPIYTCEYSATLISLPSSMSSDPLEFTVEYRSDHQMPVPRNDLRVNCEAIYDPATVQYNFTVTWNMADHHPLAREAIQVTPFNVRVIRGTILPAAVVDEFQSEQIPEGDVVIVTTLPPTVNGDAVAVVNVIRPSTNDQPFYWRRNIYPGFNPFDIPMCKSVEIFPVPPTQIELESIRFTNISNDTVLDEISFVVEWDPPQFPNGNLTSYELCVTFSETALVGRARCDFRAFDVPIEELSDPDMPSWPILPQSIEDPDLIVQIHAENEFGLMGNWSEPAILTIISDTPTPTPTPTPSPPSEGIPAWAYAIIAVVVGIILAVLLVTGVILLYRRYCFHWCSHSKYDEFAIDLNGRPYPHKHFMVPTPDEWEMKRQDIDLLTKKPLGQGAFGAVYRATLQPEAVEKFSRRKKAHDKDRRFTVSCIVAVKMLKADNLIASEKENFRKEIEMMKEVSSGENALRQFVVNMVGCVTISEPMLLVLEFVSHGDLQSYLRAMRKKFSEAYCTPDNSERSAPDSEPSGAYSHMRPAEEEYDHLGVLTERNLVDFARQIAAGMEYLFSMEIVHRDLACRNILVGDGKNLKVSDFGMSRLLPPDEVYVPTSHGPLPLRWMAIEALFYRHFTTKTDVWSYGVVLWEICTLGGFPYPSMSNRDLPEMLRSGYRMEKPETCSQEVYEVMLNCWSQTAEERPSFPELHAIFDKFLTQQTQDSYPYMEVLSKAHHIDTTAATVAHDPDPTPINLDIEITDVDAGNPMVPPSRRLTRSVSHNQPRTTLSTTITASESNFSLRSLNKATLHDSIQDIRAELARQAGWTQTDREGEVVDTRYVDSPTSFTHSRSGSRNQTHDENNLQSV